MGIKPKILLHNIQKEENMKLFAKIIIICLLIISSISVGFGLYTYISISQIGNNLITNHSLLGTLNTQIEIFDNENKLLTPSNTNGKKIANIDNLPEYVAKAFIAIEDKNFYSHNGLNLKRIAKATLNNLFSGYAKEGGSTISQQLVKNVHLTNDKTFKRKIQEAYLTSNLESQYSKRDILETYLNVIYFGNGAIGIESASQTYFNCSAKDLSIAQSAALAGIIKSPATYSPITNPEASKKRRDVVLKEMFKENFISKNEYQQAIKEPLQTVNFKSTINTSSFYSKTIQEAQKILNLSEKDVALSKYKIYTYLDNNLQNTINTSLQKALSKTGKKVDGTICVVDNQTMGIKALTTSLSNVDTTRQPGSLIKPIICYAPALENGIITPASPILDEKISYGNWLPENVDGKFDGIISARQALSQSKNIPAVKILDYVGVNNAKAFATKMGIDFKDEEHLALALGAMKYGVTPLQICACYATLANGGQFSTPRFIRKIENFDGKVIYSDIKKSTQIFSEDTAYLISDILKDSVTDGTAKKLRNIGIKLSAKTGTVGSSNNFENTDAWCASYNANNTICAWVGNVTSQIDNNLSKIQNGGTISAGLCKDAWNFFDKTKQNWVKKPEGIEEAYVDLFDWKNKQLVNIASENTPDRYKFKEIFSSSHFPKTQSENFETITPPKLEISQQSDTLTLHWNSQQFLNYDVYENGKLISQNSNSPFKTEFKEGKTNYYIIAKSKFKNEQQAKSNEINMYKHQVINSNVKNISKKWLFS